MPAEDPSDLVVRVADEGDFGAIASLRSRWRAKPDADRDFEDRVAAWLAEEGERRTIWLAELAAVPVGMASLFEYRRMPSPGQPDSRWGYVSHIFVREDCRNRGIGSRLLECLITAAGERSYARLVISPSARSLRLYRRAGFVVADNDAAGALLLVRPDRPSTLHGMRAEGLEPPRA
jgi:GNAT superfamily N-acetyltransferase